MRCLTLSLLLAAAAAPLPVLAQAVVQPLPGSSDADLLGQTMRRVAANPLDVEALVTAGEQSLKVDDLSGAASLFARADKIDPRNGRVKAGMASILVRSERPGEALRYFQQAEAAGLDPRRYAADRGLAYDLIGQQERAQRDYRLALTAGPDDETLRRYALSLGISGRRQEALDQLAPLVARSDRAAWRARAFVLAMTGDQREAEKIATTMMPGGMAQALLPFFQRLPALAASDRAFAVHFGEVRPTPERIADARLAPALPVLVAEQRPVQVAAAGAAAPTRIDERRERRGRRSQPGRVSLAANNVTVPSAAAVVASAVQQTAAPLPQVQSLPAAPAPQQVATAPLQQVQTLPTRPAPVTLAASAATLPAGATTALAPLVQPVPAQRPAATRAPLPAIAAGGTARPVAPVTTRRSNTDAVLARIVASLSIPAEELGVTGPAPRPTPALADAGARTEEVARAKTARDAQADAVAERLVEAKPATGRRGAKAASVAAAETPPPLDRKAAAKQAAAEKKALAEKKAAAAKKLAADKAAAEEKRLARANPSRIWVQVAGGANQGDLPKAWAAAKEKGGKSLSGRSGWTTRLRATNRVLTGPFKTDAEARAFVNELNKQGIGAFSFTSEAGQPVTRLPSK